MEKISLEEFTTEELNLLKDEYLYDLDRYTHKLDNIEKIIDEKITTSLKELYKCYIILKINMEKKIDEINDQLKKTYLKKNII